LYEIYSTHIATDFACRDSWRDRIRVGRTGANLLTDGQQLIFVNAPFAENTSYRIDTSDVEEAVVSEIEPDFDGPSASTDTGEGWVTAVSGDEDDDFVEIALGFGMSYNGESYSSVFVGSNTYVSFGSGSSTYSSLDENTPPIPTVHICSDDHSYQLVKYKSGEGTMRIRYEGTNSTSGDLGDPSIIYEIVFYEGESYFDVHVGINDACEEQDLIDPRISGHVAVGELLSVGSLGTWEYADSHSFTYKWQRSLGEGDWTNISGATHEIYRVTEDDIGSYLRLSVRDGATADTHYSDSTDTVADEYLISNCEDLANVIDEESPESSAALRLTDDIYCGETIVNPLSWGEDAFSGVFDGQNYTIYDLTINASETSRVALFEKSRDATFKDVNFDNADVSCSPDCNDTAIVVGQLETDGDLLTTTFSNIHITDSEVSGDSYVGPCLVSPT
jgi:hypothetical protein